MNYVEMFKELKKAGWNTYRIHNETGISYNALRKLREGDVTDPKMSTHDKLMEILKEAKKDVGNEG